MMNCARFFGVILNLSPMVAILPTRASNPVGGQDLSQTRPETEKRCEISGICENATINIFSLKEMILPGFITIPALKEVFHEYRRRIKI
jgi:hypothetical protein